MATVQDLKDFRQAVTAFYASFSASDWTRPHGDRWTFADPLYHLTTIQKALLDSIDGRTVLDEIGKMRDMDAWNNEQFAQRSATLTPAQMLADFLASWDALIDKAAQLPPDTLVYMPLMRLRGERPIDLLLEYALWHAWFHISESSVRRDGRLLALPDALQSRMVEFFFIVIAGMVDRKAAQTPFIWRIRINGAGGGAWTMRFAKGAATVERGALEQADVTMTTDLLTLMKTFLYQIERPVGAILTRRLRFKGWGRLRRLLRLVTPSRTREWAALPEDYRLLPRVE